MSRLARSISSAITFSASASCALAAAKSREPSGPRMSMISASAAGLHLNYFRKLLNPWPEVYTAWCHSVRRIRTRSYDLRRNGQNRGKHPKNRVQGTLKDPKVEHGNTSVRNRNIGRSVDRSVGPVVAAYSGHAGPGGFRHFRSSKIPTDRPETRHLHMGWTASAKRKTRRRGA
jgi:hypothetical protein